MSRTNYKVTIIDRGYNRTTYTAWVAASSRNQAIALGAALAGQEKLRREHGRTPQRDLAPEGLTDPEIKLAPVSADEYWDKPDSVEVSE